MSRYGYDASPDSAKVCMRSLAEHKSRLYNHVVRAHRDRVKINVVIGIILSESLPNIRVSQGTNFPLIPTPYSAALQSASRSNTWLRPQGRLINIAVDIQLPLEA